MKVLSVTRRSAAGFAMLALGCLPFTTATALAQVPVGTQVAELRLDRVDANAQWQLSQHVDTIEAGAPGSPGQVARVVTPGRAP